MAEETAEEVVAEVELEEVEAEEVEAEGEIDRRALGGARPSRPAPSESDSA